MIRRPPRSTRTDTLFPTRRSSDLIELNDEIFGLEPRADILFRVVNWQLANRRAPARAARERSDVRSEEHTSELQSLMRISYAVFCLKKKKQTKIRALIKLTLQLRHRI